MVVVQSLGQIEAVVPDYLGGTSYTSLALYDGYSHDYATLYSTQPNVRTTIDFLARNIAQLGLHVFRRVSDTDRARLTDHPLARLIERPNAWTTRYRFVESVVIDLGVYWNAYLLKLRPREGPVALVRIDPRLVTVEGKIAPTRYKLSFGGYRDLEVEPSQMIHFRGYSPESDVAGLSPLETLRRVLAEEYEAGLYREGFWRNAARMSGIIERPREAPDWSEAARSRFRAEFEALYSGAANSGKTAILEEGMSWKPSSFSSRDSEYLAGRKLTREEVARAYHVPLPMVGILDHATFSNITEQHKNLYQDTLGPWLQMLAEDLELQLLPEFADTRGVYLEFNINEKLRGSFEEQVASLQSAVGRPYMTADEARARLNLPSLGGDAEELVTPLNVLVGGQASPRDSAPPKALDAQVKADDAHAALHSRHVEKWTRVMERFFRRQRTVVLGRLPKALKAGTDDIFDRDRWDAELAEQLLGLNVGTAEVFARRVADLFGAEVDAAELVPYLTENARIAAESINATTREQIAGALDDDDRRSAVAHLFDIAIATRAVQIANSKVTTAASFGGHRGAEIGGARTKTWVVNSGNPRSQHRALRGVSVRLSDSFPNGMAWPGDYRGGADDVANCRCSLRFGGR